MQVTISINLTRPKALILKRPGGQTGVSRFEGPQERDLWWLPHTVFSTQPPLSAPKLSLHFFLPCYPSGGFFFYLSFMAVFYFTQVLKGETRTALDMLFVPRMPIWRSFEDANTPGASVVFLKRGTWAASVQQATEQWEKRAVGLVAEGDPEQHLQRALSTKNAERSLAVLHASSAPLFCASWHHTHAQSCMWKDGTTLLSSFCKNRLQLPMGTCTMIKFEVLWTTGLWSSLSLGD